MSKIDQIIAIAGKVQQLADIVAPGAGGAINLGVAIAKQLAAAWNTAHSDQPVTLPPDTDLIARLAATSTRVVNDGTAFLDAPQ